MNEDGILPNQEPINLKSDLIIKENYEINSLQELISVYFNNYVENNS